MSKKKPSYTEAVFKLLADDDLSVIEDMGLRNSQIRDVIKKLEELGKGDLAKEVHKEFLDGQDGPGMRPPKKGDEKEYRAQSRGRVPVVLVPVRTLGGKVGDHFRVLFDDDRIVVRSA